MTEVKAQRLQRLLLETLQKSFSKANDELAGMIARMTDEQRKEFSDSLQAELDADGSSREELRNICASAGYIHACFTLVERQLNEGSSD